MPIPITLQIPTIIRYNKNTIEANVFEDLVIKGTNFSINSVLYFYTGIDFNTGIQVIPTFISNTEIRLSSINIPANTYNFLVYNTDSKLYSNNYPIIVKNYNNLAPTLSSFTSLGFEDSIANNLYSSYFISPTGLQNQVFDGFGTINSFQDSNNIYGIPATQNVVYKMLLLRIFGTNLTGDTVIFIKDLNNNQRYFVNAVAAGIAIVDDRGLKNGLDVLIGTGASFPYGNHSIIAVNKYGISNELPFQHRNTRFGLTDDTKSNIDNENDYVYQLNSCSTNIQTFQGIDGNNYPIENYTRYLFNSFTGLRKRTYSLSESLLTQINNNGAIVINAIDNANNCDSVNCVESNYIPLGRNSINLTTAENTILDVIKGCEITITSTPGPNNSASWNAWELFSSAGGNVSISDNVGELTKQFEILSNKKINFLNLDITADIGQTINSSLTILVERFDTGSNNFVTVTSSNTGTWTVGANQKKTVAVTPFAASTRFRISITSAVDQFLTPIHTIKKLKLYDVGCPGNYYLPLGRNSTNLLTSANTFFATECEVIFENFNMGGFQILGASGISVPITPVNNTTRYFDITFPDSINISNMELLVDTNNSLGAIGGYIGPWIGLSPPNPVGGYRATYNQLGSDIIINFNDSLLSTFPNNVFGTKWRVFLVQTSISGQADLTLKKIKLFGS